MEPEAQARLGQIYAPIVFLHRDDVAPISPAEYVRRSALWSNFALTGALPPVAPAKNLWNGPELLPGAIAASAEDPDIAQRVLLWTHINNSPAQHFFLDHGGWDDHAVTPTEPLPEPGEVTENTDNLMGSAGAAHGRWDYRNFHPELDPHIGWYSVQALDMGDAAKKLDAEVVSQIANVLPSHWMIFYHFFFPYRSELIRLCEFVRTLKDLNVELPFSIRAELEAEFAQRRHHPKEGAPAAGPILNINDPQFESGIIFADDLIAAGLSYSLTWAIHLGQFVTVGLVVPEVPQSDGGPVKAPIDRFEPPRFVGFGQSAAIWPSNWGGVSSVPKMDIHAIPGPGPGRGSAPRLIGNHPEVYLFPFTHNTGHSPGEYARPVSEMHPPICDLQRGGGVDEDLPFDEKQRRRQRFWVTLLKLATGGYISAIIEAADDDKGGFPDVPVPPSDPKDSISEEDVGLILKPEEVELSAELMGTFEDNVVVRDWGGTPEQRIFDENWKTANLSWGPPALQDPGLRRQGQPMPDFLGPFINELGRQLELGD